MSLFREAKAQIAGQKAVRAHIAANEAAGKGSLEEAKKKYDAAFQLYEEALREGSNKPGIHQGFAILLIRLGDYERAMHIMENISRMPGLKDEDWFDLRVNYSVCLWKKGRLDDAIDTIRRASKIMMKSTVYTTLGMYLVEKARQTGNFEEAQAFGAQAMEYDDKDPGVLDNMGDMYMALSELAMEKGEEEAAIRYRRQAKDYYIQAHEIKPRQITTIYSLAGLYHEENDDAEARKVMEDAEDLYYSAACPVSEEMMNALKLKIG